MLFILALLLFPCALVGAFVTADDHDLAAFQAGSFFSFEPLAGALRGRSNAGVASKNAVPMGRRSHCQGAARRKNRAPAISMLIGGECHLPSIRSLGSTNENDCSAFSPASALVWPCASSAWGTRSESQRNTYTPNSRNRRRGRSCSSNSENSESALKAMSIPARCALPSVDLLREAYGPRRSFWGDLSARETRRFYHELLPVSLMLEALVGRGGGASNGVDGRASGIGGANDDGVSDATVGGGRSGGGLAAVVDAGGVGGEFGSGGVLTLEEQAWLASTARHAARLYARERCALPSRVLAHLYDGLRHLKNYGTFRVTGMTWQQLWEKYEARVKASDPSLEGDDLKERVCLVILEKSCCTSEVFNNLAGCGELNAVFGASALPAVGRSTEATASLGAPDRAGGRIDGSSSGCVVPSSEGMGALEARPGADETGKDIDGTESKALARASAAECAAACAGALRLTRLVKPFIAIKDEAGQVEVEGKVEGEEQPEITRRRQRRSVGRQRLSRRARRPRTST